MTLQTKRPLRFLIWMALGAVGGAAFWAALFFAQMGAPTGRSRWIHDSAQVKRAAIQRIRGPKVLLLGGSSVMYGVRAARLQQRLGLPAVNMGINAGLQLPHMLWEAKRALKSGDVAVLLFEYAVYEFDGRPNDVFADYVVSRDREAFMELSPAWQAQVIFQLPFERLLSGLKSRYVAEPIRIPGELQGSDLNENGDQLLGNLQKSRNAALLDELVIRGIAKTRWIDMAGPAWPQVTEFLRWCRDNNVRVLAGHPPLIHFDDVEDPAFLANLAQVDEFYAAQGVPVLGKPMDFVYPKEWFYDSGWHLHQGSMDAHTDNLARYLAPYLKLDKRSPAQKLSN